MTGVLFFLLPACRKTLRASYAESWLSNQKEEKRRSHPDSWGVSISEFLGAAIRFLYACPTLL
jgi:hypothetical protein